MQFAAASMDITAFLVHTFLELRKLNVIEVSTQLIEIPQRGTLFC
jgi:hypothetical protein